MSTTALTQAFDLIEQAPDLREALAPLLKYRASLLASDSVTTFEPSFPLKKMLIWLCGFSCDRGLFKKAFPAASVEETAYFQHVQAALARDEEPPLEWLERAVRHIDRWLETGHFAFAGYYTLRRLHFLTRGYTTLWIRYLHQQILPVAPANAGSVFSSLPKPQKQALYSEGYAQWAQQLSRETCAAIETFARNTRAKPAYHDPNTSQPAYLLFEPERPVARRYDFDAHEMWRCPEIQAVAAQERWFTYASDFLQSPARLVQAYFWWSVATDLPESRTTGQVFHVDLDRFHFVNCFFYITDVSIDNGPHQYVAGSQAPPPLELAVDQRWTEQELLAVYGEKALRTLTGSAGDVILGDTRAFHRGKPLTKGVRLMLQLEFASSTLSDPAPVITLPNNLSPELTAALQQRPEAYPIFAL